MSITSNDLFCIVYILSVDTVAILSNGYICFAIYTDKKRLLIYRIIGQQCLSDMMFAVASLLSFVVCSHGAIEYSLYFRWMCDFNNVLFYVSIHVSSVCLTLSAVERLLQPTRSRLYLKLRAFLENQLLVIMWLTAVVCGTYMAIAADTVQIHFGRKTFLYCVKPFAELEYVTSYIRSSFGLFAITTLTGALFPLLSILICYPIIFLRLRNANLSASQKQDCRTLIKMLVAINLALLVLRTPSGLVGLIYVHSSQDACLDPRQGFGLNNITFYYVFVLHIVVNPVILCYYNPKFLLKLQETIFKRLLPSNDTASSQVT